MYKLKNLLIICFILSSICSHSQCGISGETLEINTDEELANLSECDSIFGNLYISLIETSFLEPLSDLEYIEGFLHIEGCISLLDLDDLSSLMHIGNDLIIESNFTLQNLNGFNSLSYLGNDLNIKGNWSIESLSNFSSLENINGNLILSQNNVLENIDGLESIQHIFGDLVIESSNVDLSDLSGLSSLTQIDGNWDVNLDELTTINGFSNLESIGDSLKIIDFSVLSNVDGFTSLTEVGSLVIENNDNFVNADGLINLSNVIEDCVVQDNQAFFLCCGLYPLLNEGSIGGETIISNNSGPCSSAQEILEECFYDHINDEQNSTSSLQIIHDQQGIQIQGEFDYWTLLTLDGRIIDKGIKSSIFIDQSGFYLLNITIGSKNIAHKISR